VYKQKDGNRTNSERSDTVRLIKQCLDKIGTVDSEDADYVYVVGSDTNSQNKLQFVELPICNSTVRLAIDTGATTNIIDEQTW
jgi:hypothetical protein